MSETRIATLFETGPDQAVRLPPELRLPGERVYVTRDDATGDLVLSTRPGARTWDAFFDLLEATDVPDDFMADRPLNVLPDRAGVFDDERENDGQTSD
jgi:antitoxin VapB